MCVYIFEYTRLQTHTDIITDIHFTNVYSYSNERNIQLIFITDAYSYTYATYLCMHVYKRTYTTAVFSVNKDQVIFMGKHKMKGGTSVA